MTKSSKKSKNLKTEVPYQFESVEIENFRGLRRLTLDGLGRINLIAGKNSVGKSTLLEALVLLCGTDDASLAHGVNALRGLPIYTANAVETFGPLFTQQDVDRAIEITGIAKDAWKRVKLTLPLAPLSDHNIPASVAVPFPTISGRLLHVDYSDSSGRASSGEVVVNQSGIHNRPGKLSTERLTLNSLIIKNFLDPQNSARFSKLDQEGKADELIPLLQIIEPRLKKLSIQVLQPAQSNLSQQAALFADIGIGKQIPLAFAGDGLHRAVAAFLALAQCKGGMLLLDEIENGIHHGSMKKLWQAIFKLAEQYDTQIFATTHSWEAIKSAHDALIELSAGDALRLFRLQREGENVVAKRYDIRTLDAALDSEIEVR